MTKDKTLLFLYLSRINQVRGSIALVKNQLKPQKWLYWGVIKNSKPQLLNPFRWKKLTV